MGSGAANVMILCSSESVWSSGAVYSSISKPRPNPVVDRLLKTTLYLMFYGESELWNTGLLGVGGGGVA